MSGREDDLRMLREALALEKLDERARDAFADMLAVMSRVTGDELSEKQRAWVRNVLGEETYENAVSSGKVPKVLRHRHPELAECTAGCPAWVPPSLRNRPLKPPGRPA